MLVAKVAWVLLSAFFFLVSFGIVVRAVAVVPVAGGWSFGSGPTWVPCSPFAFASLLFSPFGLSSLALLLSMDDQAALQCACRFPSLEPSTPDRCFPFRRLALGGSSSCPCLTAAPRRASEPYLLYVALALQLNATSSLASSAGLPLLAIVLATLSTTESGLVVFRSGWLLLWLLLLLRLFSPLCQIFGRCSSGSCCSCSDSCCSCHVCASQSGQSFGLFCLYLPPLFAAVVSMTPSLSLYPSATSLSSLPPSLPSLQLPTASRPSASRRLSALRRPFPRLLGAPSGRG